MTADPLPTVVIGEALVPNCNLRQWSENLLPQRSPMRQFSDQPPSTSRLPRHPPPFDMLGRALSYASPITSAEQQSGHPFHVLPTPTGAGVVRGRTGIGLMAMESPKVRRRPLQRVQSDASQLSPKHSDHQEIQKQADEGQKTGKCPASTPVTPAYVWEAENTPSALSPFNSPAVPDPQASYFPLPSTRTSPLRPPASSRQPSSCTRTAAETLGRTEGPAILWHKGKKLGEGSFGTVFSALDLLTGITGAFTRVICMMAVMRAWYF